MDINEQLDRIQAKGVSVTIRWGRSVRFMALEKYDKLGKPIYKVNFSFLRKEKHENFKQVIYQAIMAFDDAYPQYL